MSTQQSIDPELVEQTKQQIRNLVREIAQLSKSELSPLEFYEAILNRVVSALAAVGGAIWMLEQGRLDLEYHINLRETGLGDSPEKQAQHGQLLRKVITSGEGMIVSPHSGAGDEEQGGNPTDFLLVLGPLKTDQETQGVIEIFQRPGSAPNVQRGYLRFLIQMCELAGDYLKTRQLRHFTDRQTLWAQLEGFTRSAHRSLDPLLTSYTIANEGRRLIECDRVSVAICKGRKCVIQAVSGQDTFDKRSNLVTLLGRLATAVVATGEAIWYTGDTTQMAPQVEEAVQAYVDESHAKTVGVIPLVRLQEEDDKESPYVLGALLVEQIEDSVPKEGMMQRVEIVRDHSAAALANALEYHSLFLLPVWKALGKAQWVLKARTLPKTMAVLASVLVVLGALVFWPADFQLEGRGIVQPAERREVYAALGGIITEVNVTNGQHVEKGRTLATMRNFDLDTEINKTMGDLNIALSEFRNYDYRSRGRDLATADRLRFESEKAKLQRNVASLKFRMDLLKNKRNQLTITSPIRGQVEEWNVEELLLERPVQPGQRLMTIADPDREWELELKMPESRMGHIADAQRALGKDLKVTYYIATEPGARHEGRVKEVHTSAEARAEEGNTVLVKVAIDKNDLADPFPGASVTAKIYCGRASLGYVWLHDLIAWVQTKILFRLF